MCIKKMLSNNYQHTGRKLSPEEISSIYLDNPYVFVDNNPIVLKDYKDGRREMFVKILDKHYLIKQKDNKDEWYEVVRNE